MAWRSAQNRFVAPRARVRPPRAGQVVFWFAAFVALCFQIFAVGFHCPPAPHADGAVVYSGIDDAALSGLPCSHRAASGKTNSNDRLPSDKDGSHNCPLCGTLQFVSILPALDVLILPRPAAPAPVQVELANLAPRAAPHSGQPRAPPVSI